MLWRECLYLVLYIIVQLVNLISCDEGSTLAFAIDDTGSMWDDIDQVKTQAKAIMEIVRNSNATDIRDMVLVTINDPDVILRKKTTSPDVFIAALNKIKAHNIYNLDCPEMALTGIQEALKASRQGSYVYVFTDASAKDYHKVDQIKNLCQKKQSQVIFVLTGDCYDAGSKNYRVFYDVAEACSGQVFRVNKNEVGSILEVLKVLLRATTSVFKWVNVPASFSYVKVPFELDEKAEYALVSTSGTNVELKVTTTPRYFGPEPDHIVTLWKRNSKAMELTNPNPGTYYAWVRGDSTVSVVVYGRTDFTFDYGFSILEPKSLNDATKQPIAGAQQHVSIKVTDPDNSVEIKTLQILEINKNDAVITELPLRDTGSGFFITDPFVAPTHTFRIAVKGKIKRTKQPIVRNSRTNINPMFVDLTPRSAPVVDISEGSNVDVTYGADVTVTCNVRAHPPPAIAWYTAAGVLIPTESSEKSKPDYISYMKLKQVKSGDTYVCRAKNSLGAGEKSIQVKIQPVLKLISIGKANSASLGRDQKLLCGITSHLPITRKWFKAGKEIVQSEHESISRDGSELTLKSVSVDMQGTYTCEATLNSDPTVRDTRTIEVVIPGLASPKIKSTKRNINVKEGETFSLDCGMSNGYPKPRVQWVKVRPAGSPIPVDTEVLTIDRSTFQHAGQYRCVVTNPLGTDSAMFDVTVNVPPKVVVNEATVTLPYNSTKTLVCKGEAYPPPTVEWKDGHGQRVTQQQVSQSSDYQFVSTLKLEHLTWSAIYICVVSNKDSAVNDRVSITVLSPLRKNTHTPEKLLPTFGEDPKIQCGITSDLPITRKWFKAGKEIVQSEHESISRDGSELTLKSVSVDMQGTYTCEATLNSDPTVRDTRTIEVVIPGLASPKIKSTKRNINVKEGETFSLDCGISNGYPKPRVQWVKVRPAGSPIPVDTEVLTIDRSTFQHAGQYRCVVTNPLGTDSALFDVTVNVPPKVVVNEATVTLPYNSTKTLVCKGEAYPPPTVEWKDGHGQRVTQQQVSQSSDYQFVSTLKLEHLTWSAIYICVVSNKDSAVNDRVSITVLSPLRKNTHTPEKLLPTFGEDPKIQCGITSDLPITRKWFKAGKEIVQSEHESISRDGSELTLKSVSVDMQGTYTCEATLNSDPTVRDTRTIAVAIPGLTSPNIKSTNRNMNVKEGDKFSLDCGISKGYPKPRVQWVKVRPAGSPIPVDTEVLTIDRSTFQHAGQYRCVVTNPLGTDSATFDVTVNVPPKVVVNETTVILPYNSAKTLVCKGEAYPPPTVEWRDEHGHRLTQQQISQFSEYQFESTFKSENLRRSAAYTCVVSNKDGAVNLEVSITVLSPFRKNLHASANINPGFGKDAKISCDITSDWPITRKWFKAGKEIVQSEHESISRDGSELTLKSVSVDMQGTYTCEATLNSDPTVRDTRTIEVVIPGLVSPKIKLTKRTLNVKEGEKFSLDCGISNGYPKPRVQWVKVRPAGSPIPVDTEVLTIDRSTFQHAGQYRCVVTNPLGTDFATFDVKVTGPPNMFLDKTSRSIAYNSGAELTCKGEAYPTPTVQWTDEKEQALHQQLIKVSEYQLTSILKLENIQRSAEYTCVVSNKDGSVSDKAIITVLSPFETHSHVEGATAIKYGASHTLQCDIKSKQPINIKWYFLRIGTKSAKQNIVSSDKYDVSRDGTRLTIKSMDLNMDGQYTCEASLMSDPNEKVAYTTNVNVVGLSTPEINPSSFVDRKNFTAVCRVTGVPPPAISWQYKPKGSDVFSTILGSGEVLNMPNMKLSDSGMYKCIAKNILGEMENNFNVNVEEEPIITNTVRNHFALEGDLVMRITCNVTGYPEPTIVWKKGKTILSSDMKNVIKDGSLYIKSPIISDTGDYVCEATNKLGSDTATFSVDVTDTFADDDNYIGKTHEIIAEQEDSEIIRCDLNEAKTESIRWYKDGYLTNQRGSVYTIDKVSVSDEGNYTCRDNTKEGSTSETYFVYIGYPPIFDDDMSPVTIFWEDSQQILDCRADSQPKAKYEWFHNGKLMIAGYNLVQKRITDWGDYTCNVYNALGSIQKSFKVVIEGCFITNTVGYPKQPLASDESIPTWKYLMSNSGIKLKENEEIKFSCPSTTRIANSFKIAPNKKELIAKCITQDTFSVAGKTYQYSELQCEHRVEATVEATGKQCAGHNSEMVRVGFPVNGFLEAYNVCYDKQKNVPIYANTSSPALTMGSGADTGLLEWSPTPELGEHTTGDWKPAGSCHCCYTKEALLDTNELPFGPAQAATYKNNLNSVPVWNPKCDDDENFRISWQSFNNEVRELSQMHEKVSIWTGASEYTYTDGGFVPRYLWKVMSLDGVPAVLVYVNVRAPRVSDVRCSAPCQPPVQADRALYCCDLNEFQDKFHVTIDAFVTREIYK